MKALVLGCNGYVGRHLCRYAARQGWEIRGADLQAAPNVEVASYSCVDVRDVSCWARIDCDVDAIFMFAGRTGTMNSFEDFGDFIDTNDRGLVALLEALRRTGLRPRVVFPSSRLVYRGAAGVALREDAVLEPRTVYAQTKVNGEAYLALYARCFGIDYTVVRICVPYGNELDDQYSYGTLGHFFQQVRNGESLRLFGDGLQRRSFIHVGDLSRMVVELAGLRESAGRILNVGGPDNLSIGDVVDMMSRKYDVPAEHVPWPPELERIESGDTVFDSSEAEQLVGREYQWRFREWLTGL